jgi:dienelactone hydrolase
LAGLRNGAEGQQRPLSDVHVSGTQHGFHNDTTPRFDKAAAALAWQRTTDFFKRNLASS